MAKGNYIVNSIEDNDIFFQIIKDPDEIIPDEQQDLVILVASTLDSIKLIYKDDVNTIKKYTEQLLKLSQVGLVGLKAQPTMAKKLLSKLE